MGVWWHALAFVTHERAKMSHKPGRNVTQAGPKCHTRAKMSHSHVIIATDTWFFVVARLQANGNDLVCYLHTIFERCVGNLGTTLYKSNEGYPCPLLRIVESCSIFWVPYAAGEPIPAQVVIGGSMANGDVTYVVKFNIHFNGKPKSLAGYYVKGATHATSSFVTAQYSTDMMMMVVL